MGAQHTPGPWVAEIYTSLEQAKKLSGFEWTDKWRSESPPASVWHSTNGGITGLPGCIETTAANAHLIAAAPDLLEALEELTALGSLELPQRRDAALLKARAAIAKAKGGNP